MARGWESKGVEAQIESAEADRHTPATALSAEQADWERKKQSLLLSRTRVLRDLKACSNPRYRRALEEGLAFLEKQLRQMGAAIPES